MRLIQIRISLLILKYIQRESEKIPKIQNNEKMSTPIRRSSRLQRLSLSRGEENQDAPVIITKNKSVRKPKKVLTNVVNTISEVRLNNPGYESYRLIL